MDIVVFKLRKYILRWYFSSSLSTISFIVSFAINAYLSASFTLKSPIGVIVFCFFGTLLLHDLILLPAYVLIDYSLVGLIKRMPLPETALGNYVKYPSMISILMLFLYIFTKKYNNTMQGKNNLEAFFSNWLLLTAGIFILAFIYLLFKTKQFFAIKASTNSTAKHRISPNL